MADEGTHRSCRRVSEDGLWHLVGTASGADPLNSSSPILALLIGEPSAAHLRLPTKGVWLPFDGVFIQAFLMRRGGLHFCRFSAPHGMVCNLSVPRRMRVKYAGSTSPGSIPPAHSL